MMDDDLIRDAVWIVGALVFGLLLGHMLARLFEVAPHRVGWWWVVLMEVRVVGICGPAGSGKSLAGHALQERFGFIGLEFAAPIKRMLRDGLKLDQSQVFGDRKELPIEELGGRSPRELMRSLGDWGRAQHPGMWVMLLEQAVGRVSAGCYGAHFSSGGPVGVVIDDVRLEAEADWIRGRDGLLLHLRRLGVEPDAGHITEAGIERRPGEPVITNNGSSDELSIRVVDAVSSWLTGLAE